MTGREGRSPFPVLVAVLALRCATAGPNCLDSETCCLQAHPGNPAACGLTSAEAASILAAGAATTATLATSDAEDDDSDEGWRQHCVETYVLCKSQKPRWVGRCYDCLRFCEGQRQWPFGKCHRP